MPRAKWGKAKLIVSALRSEIERLYSENLNLEEIYLQLSADGKIDIGKRTFKRHASDIIKSTRTLTLKRLLNDEIITPDEFKTRADARLGALASPSPLPSKNPIQEAPSQSPAAEPSSDPKPTQKPKRKSKASSTKPKAFKHDPRATDEKLW